jgi:hypothetical protein
MSVSVSIAVLISLSTLKAPLCEVITRETYCQDGRATKFAARAFTREFSLLVLGQMHLIERDVRVIPATLVNSSF